MTYTPNVNPYKNGQGSHWGRISYMAITDGKCKVHETSTSTGKKQLSKF